MWRALAGFLVIGATWLAGCGDNMPEPEEESSMVADDYMPSCDELDCDLVVCGTFSTTEGELKLCSCFQRKPDTEIGDPDGWRHGLRCETESAGI